MKDMGTIYCSASQAVPLIVGKDTVYVHTQIEQVKVDHLGLPVDNLWKCREVQYEKDEYIEALSKEQTDVQLALTELYERLEGK